MPRSGLVALALLVVCAQPAAAQMMVGSPVQSGPDGMLMRTSPGFNGTILGTFGPGARGVVKDGPIEMSGYTWWLVDFDGIVGWASEGPRWLTLAPTVVSPRAMIEWTQEGPDVSTVSRFAYIPLLDTDVVPANALALQGVTCEGMTPVFTCRAPLPPMSPGPHTLRLVTRCTRESCVGEFAPGASLPESKPGEAGSFAVGFRPAGKPVAVQ